MFYVICRRFWRFVLLIIICISFIEMIGFGIVIGAICVGFLCRRRVECIVQLVLFVSFRCASVLVCLRLRMSVEAGQLFIQVLRAI